MIRCACFLAAAVSFASAASADMAFKVQNASAGPASVTMDGKQVCTIDSGKSCTVTISDGDAHAFAFALAGGVVTAFQPGNLEMVDTCKIDQAGAHCVDPTGAKTN